MPEAVLIRIAGDLLTYKECLEIIGIGNRLDLDIGLDAQVSARSFVFNLVTFLASLDGSFAELVPVFLDAGGDVIITSRGGKSNFYGRTGQFIQEALDAGVNIFVIALTAREISKTNWADGSERPVKTSPVFFHAVTQGLADIFGEDGVGSIKENGQVLIGEATLLDGSCLPVFDLVNIGNIGQIVYLAELIGV